MRQLFKVNVVDLLDGNIGVDMHENWMPHQGHWELEFRESIKVVYGLSSCRVRLWRGRWHLNLR